MAERPIDLILNNKYVLWQVVKGAAWLLSGTRRRHKQRRHRNSRFNKLQEVADSGARLRGVGGSKPARNPGRVWASCASASELVVGKINVSLMARVIFHYVQFARELLPPTLRRNEALNERNDEWSKGIPIPRDFPSLDTLSFFVVWKWVRHFIATARIKMDKIQELSHLKKDDDN